MEFFRGHFFALLLIFSAVLVVGAGSAQQRQNPKCPTTRVTCPDEVKKGEKLLFTANVQGGDPNVTPTYNWTVSTSSIESGQGTSTIEVNTKDVEAGTNITATVDIGGYDRECGYGSTAASCTTGVVKK